MSLDLSFTYYRGDDDGFSFLPHNITALSVSFHGDFQIPVAHLRQLPLISFKFDGSISHLPNLCTITSLTSIDVCPSMLTSLSNLKEFPHSLSKLKALPVLSIVVIRYISDLDEDAVQDLVCAVPALTSLEFQGVDGITDKTLVALTTRRLVIHGTTRVFRVPQLQRLILNGDNDKITGKGLLLLQKFGHTLRELRIVASNGEITNSGMHAFCYLIICPCNYLHLAFS